jgi:signal peptidase I
MSESTQAEPSPSAPRRRRPWLAALMSLLWPGVGQLYNGEARKAFTVFAAWATLSCVLAGFSIVAAPGPMTIIVLFVLIALILCVLLYGAIEAFRQARRPRAVVLKRYQRAWLYVLSAVAILLFAHVTTRLFAWRPFSISSASMVPTVEPGDYVMTKRYAPGEAPQRGDLAIFHFPRDRSIDYFKRVVGLPGDRIQLRSGIVYVNGTPLGREPQAGLFPSKWTGKAPIQYVETMPEGRRYNIVKVEDSGWRNDTSEFVVPADRYFVLGDNRDNSADSRDREIGFIPRDDIIDRAYVVYWSANRSRIAAPLE